MYFDIVPAILALHDHLIPAPPATPVYVPVAPSFEPARQPMYWPPGALTGAHKFTDNVYHRHLWIAQKGHNLGMMLGHISIPPTDLLMPIHIIGSSRKATFGAGEVKANGQPIACCTVFDLGVIPTPMTACGKIPNPEAGTGGIAAWWANSLIVGQHWIDLAMGWADAIIAAFLGALSTAGASAPSGVASFTDAVGRGFIGQVSPGSASSIGSAAVRSAIVGVIGLAGQVFSDYRGDVQFSASSHFGLAARGTIALSRSGEDGAVTGSTTGRIGHGTTNIHHSSEVRFRPDGQGGWTADVGQSAGATAFGASADGDLSTDGGWTHSSESPNSPFSEGTSYHDLPFL